MAKSGKKDTEKFIAINKTNGSFDVEFYLIKENDQNKAIRFSPFERKPISSQIKESQEIKNLVKAGSLIIQEL